MHFVWQAVISNTALQLVGTDIYHVKSEWQVLSTFCFHCCHFGYFCLKDSASFEYRTSMSLGLSKAFSLPCRHFPVALTVNIRVRAKLLSYSNPNPTTEWMIVIHCVYWLKFVWCITYQKLSSTKASLNAAQICALLLLIFLWDSFWLK